MSTEECQECVCPVDGRIHIQVTSPWQRCIHNSFTLLIGFVDRLYCLRRDLFVFAAPVAISAGGPGLCVSFFRFLLCVFVLL